MTSKVFTTSVSQRGTIWTGVFYDFVYVNSGVVLADTDPGAPGNPATPPSSALYDGFGSGTAEINGAVLAVGDAIQFGAVAASGERSTIAISSAGSVMNTRAGFDAIVADSVPANGTETESIANAGLIEGVNDGITSTVSGAITNNGTISGGVIGVLNLDNFGGTVTLNNHGAKGTLATGNFV